MQHITLPIKVALVMLWAVIGSVQAVEIHNPFVREPLPGVPNSAAFMNVVNDTNQPVSIISATSPASDYVELHNHIHDQGVMRMRQIDKIVIPALGRVALKPGGLHIMLFNIKPIKAGDQLELTLNFSDGTHKTIMAPVKRILSHHLMKHGQKMHHNTKNKSSTMKQE